MAKQDSPLATELARCFDDPMRFALWAFPFGEIPELSIVPLQEPWASRYPNCKYGPDKWTCELLDEVGRQVRENGFTGEKSVKPVKVAVASGHGIGKSFTTAILVAWIMATRPNSKGVVTANTAAQLETKTMAEVKKWLKMSLVADMFDVNATSIRAVGAAESWRLDAYTCKEENSEAFAGQHSASSSSFYIFDEASAVPDKIWEVAEGGMTDGEPFWFVFGNPTRNTGRFRECFGSRADKWTTWQIDSRQAFITNKATIEEWRQEYGEDSDFFRVRVLGKFPNASTSQFISSAAVDRASESDVQHNSATCAVIGVDVARFGDDDSVIYTRIGRGYLPIKRYHGLDTVQLTGRVKEAFHEALRIGFPRSRVYLHVDETGVGAGVKDLLKDAGYPVRGVNFGHGADAPEMYDRKRDEMWGRMRDWLEDGGTIPNDPKLKEELVSPEFEYRPNGQIKLESKKDMKRRGLPSPDVADALALTFAFKIQEYTPLNELSNFSTGRRTYDPFACLK